MGECLGVVRQLKWVKKHLGEKAWKRLILSHHKNLNQGDFLVDDRDKNGAGEFTGTLIRFYPGKTSWPELVKELLAQA